MTNAKLILLVLGAGVVIAAGALIFRMTRPETAVAPETAAVPRPTDEDAVRTFFALIAEKRVPDAVSMLDASIAADDATRQAWGVQFSGWGNVAIKDLKPFTNQELTGGQDIWQATFSTSGGEETRWLTIVKNSAGVWKITGVATGP